MSAVPEEFSIPLRECAPWCVDGDGHGDAHPEDRSCWSDIPNLLMSRMPPVRWSDNDWGFDSIMVCARRRPEGLTAEIVLTYEGTSLRNPGCELRFTAEEAAALAARLTHLVGLIV